MYTDLKCQVSIPDFLSEKRHILRFMTLNKFQVINIVPISVVIPIKNVIEIVVFNIRNKVCVIKNINNTFMNFPFCAVFKKNHIRNDCIHRCIK